MVELTLGEKAENGLCQFMASCVVSNNGGVTLEVLGLCGGTTDRDVITSVQTRED